MTAPSDTPLDPGLDRPQPPGRGGMNRETQSIVVAMLGGLLIAITVSGRFTSYVKPGFAPLLLAGGGILVVIGLISLTMAVWDESRAHREHAVDGPAPGSAAPLDPGTEAPGHGGHDHDAPRRDASGPDAHGHDHDRSRAPWLLLVPVLVLLLVAPPALGADSVSRTARSQALSGVDLVSADTPVSARATMGGAAARAAGGTAATGGISGGMTFGPLPAGTDPPLGLKDVVLRALYDPAQTLVSTPVTVIGFLAPAGDGFDGGYSIARMVISCCAADANPMQVHVEGTAPLPENTWVSAVVTVVPGTGVAGNNYVPTVAVVSMSTVAQPDDPYEH